MAPAAARAARAAASHADSNQSAAGPSGSTTPGAVPDDQLRQPDETANQRQRQEQAVATARRLEQAANRPQRKTNDERISELEDAIVKHDEEMPDYHDYARLATWNT
jgi:hypothetical protein